MATISKHYGKWQAQIRIKDYPNKTKSFLLKKDAELWARQTEISLQKDDLGIKLKTYPTFMRNIIYQIYLKRILFIYHSIKLLHYILHNTETRDFKK